jgi:hypothetical protein
LTGEGVPNISQFRLWWAYVSHKLLRSWLPVFLVSALASSVALCFWNPLWLIAAVPQILFYWMAALGHLVPSFGAGAGRIPFYFTMVNVAILIGLMRGLANREKALGFKTSRQALTRPPE